MFFQASEGVKFSMQQIEYIKWYTDEIISRSKFIVSFVSVVTVRFVKLSD